MVIGADPPGVPVVRTPLLKAPVLPRLEFLVDAVECQPHRSPCVVHRDRHLVGSVFAQRVEEEWAHLKNGSTTLTVEEIERMMAFFNGSDYQIIDDVTEMEQLREIADGDRAFSRRLARNVVHQKQPGYAAVALSLKPAGVAPGDLTDVQLNAIADLSDTFAQGEIRTTHNQNMVIVDVLKFKLYAFWQTAKRFGLATPNIGTLTDIIC